MTLLSFSVSLFSSLFICFNLFLMVACLYIALVLDWSWERELACWLFGVYTIGCCFGAGIYTWTVRLAVYVDNLNISYSSSQAYSSSYPYQCSSPKPYPEILAFVCHVCPVASRPSPIYIFQRRYLIKQNIAILTPLYSQLKITQCHKPPTTS